MLVKHFVCMEHCGGNVYSAERILDFDGFSADCAQRAALIVRNVYYSCVKKFLQNPSKYLEAFL